jgi:hypothetical protein
MSKRRRGNLLRAITIKTQRQQQLKIAKTIIGVGKKANEMRQTKNMRIPYSERKIIAKKTELYSVLKPETSSDSPSAKSKGAR